MKNNFHFLIVISLVLNIMTASVTTENQNTIKRSIQENRNNQILVIQKRKNEDIKSQKTIKNSIITLTDQLKKDYQEINRINLAVEAQRAKRKNRQKMINQINSSSTDTNKTQKQITQKQQTSLIVTSSIVNPIIFNTPEFDHVVAYRPSVTQSSSSPGQKTQDYLNRFILPQLPILLPKAIQCTGVFVASLNTCILPECPLSHKWNPILQQCDPPPITCKSNMTWNGTACIPNILLSNPVRITSQYILQTNGIKCPKGVMKCNKPVCPKSFVWLQNVCVPIKNGQICPQANLINSFCMPNYIAQITIKEKCVDNKYGGFACAQISNAYKYIGNVPLNFLNNIKQLIPSKQQTQITNQQPIINKTKQSSIKAEQKQQKQQNLIDYTISGAANPIVRTYLPPRYIPLPQPRYLN